MFPKCGRHFNASSALLCRWMPRLPVCVFQFGTICPVEFGTDLSFLYLLSCTPNPHTPLNSGNVEYKLGQKFLLFFSFDVGQIRVEYFTVQNFVVANLYGFVPFG